MSWLITPQQKTSAGIPWEQLGNRWTPAAITTALWLDAADASTVTTVSGAVSQWNDKSGNGRNAAQVVASFRPTYNATGLNGSGTIVLNGTNQFLVVPDFYQSDWFMLVVAKTNSASTNQEILNKIDGNVNREWLFRITDQNKLLGLSNPVGNLGASNTFLTTTASVGTAFAALGFLKNGITCQLGINGVIESGNLNTSTVYNGVLSIRIGASESNSNYLNGEIQKIVITAGAPSDATMRQLEGWAAWSSGLQSLLPADHPYKSAAPTL